MKSTVRYMCHDMKKSITIFYLILLSLYLTSYVLNTMLDGVYFSMNGNVSSSVYAFIVGIVVLKEPFLMALQNGVSRKTYWFSTLLTFGLSAAVISIAETFFTSIGRLVNSETFRVESIYSMIYSKRVADLDGFREGIETLLLLFALTFMLFAIGYFIGTLYYRMSKTIRLLVSIGTPVLLLFVLPLVESTFTKGAIIRFAGKVALAALGYKTQNPYTFMLSGLLVSVVMMGLSWLLIRRAIEKKD